MEVQSYNEHLVMDADPIPLAFRCGGSFLDVDTPTKASVPGSFSEAVAPGVATLTPQTSLPACLFSPLKSYSEVLSATDAIANFFYVDKRRIFDEGDENRGPQQPSPLKNFSFKSSQQVLTPADNEPNTIIRGAIPCGLPPIRTTQTTSSPDPHTVPRSHHVVETAAPYPSRLSFHEELQPLPSRDPELLGAIDLKFPEGAFDVLPPNEAAAASRDETGSEFSAAVAEKRHSDTASEVVDCSISDIQEADVAGDEDEMDDDYDAADQPKRRKISKTKVKKRQAVTLAVAVDKPGRQACRNCLTTQTPQWREGPEGARTLCNACGLRFRKGLPLPYWSN